MARKKATRKSPTAGRAPKAQGPRPATIAVYAVLAVLVIGTSFYLGYLVSGSDGASTRTGSEGVEKLTIVEYSDFQCPFCQRAVPTVKQLKENYGDQVEIVYKHFPLESIHPDAFNAAVASECVREEGGEEAFWEYHDILFANQHALDTASLERYADQVGVDIGTCLANQETAEQVRADMAEGRQRGVSGTPSFWVHNELVVGAVPYAQIAAKVDEKLSGSAAPAPAPTPAPAAPQPAQRADVDVGSHILGDEDAPVMIVEFTDYECPFCKRAHDQTLDPIRKNYIDKGLAAYTVRNYPLPIHSQAQKASEAAECAGKLGGAEAFFAYGDLLFENQADLSVPALKRYAGELSLDQSAFDACLDRGEFASLVQSDVSAGGQAGVSGTPTFFINGKKLVGAQPYSAFEAAINAELE